MNHHHKSEAAGGHYDHNAKPTELESLLRNIALTAPSGRLDIRVSHVLRASGSVARIRAAVFGVAAAIMLLIGLGLLVRHQTRGSERASINPSPPKVLPAVNISRPLRIERDASSMADAGIIGFAGKVPLHGYRYESVRQIWYVDPQGKRLCVTIPDKRVVLVPIHPF